MGNKTFGSKPPKKWRKGVAVVGGRYSENYFYIEGFYKASDTLISFALNEGKRSSDLTLLIHPICYNFRHYVELELKQLIEQLEKELDSSLTTGSVLPRLTETHNLNDLLEWFILHFALTV